MSTCHNILLENSQELNIKKKTVSWAGAAQLRRGIRTQKKVKIQFLAQTHASVGADPQ